MKLTAEQIKKIEETLVLNGIQYEDIKLELTDHIASEIEEKTSIQGVSFEIAFHEVFENWQEPNETKFFVLGWINLFIHPELLWTDGNQLQNCSNFKVIIYCFNIQL